MKRTKTVLLSVLTVSVAQILLKYGVNQLGTISYQLSNLGSTFFTIFSNPEIFIGLILFLLSSLLWLVAISESELSYAYPLLGAGYALVALLSWVLFNETMSLLRILGIVVVFIGVYMMSRS